MLTSLNRNLSVRSRQFGFKDNFNCQTAILTVQEVMQSYTLENSRVHCVLIDLTKAFDKLNFDVLRAAKDACSSFYYKIIGLYVQ